MAGSKIALTIFLLFTAFVLQAQIPVGYHFDNNGNEIAGYYDILAYQIKNKTSINFSEVGYEEGRYYNNTGKQITGLIKIANDKIWFKKDKESKKQKLTAKEVSSFVVGIDSFFTASNFYLERKSWPVLTEEPKFMHHITSFGDLVYARHFEFTGTGSSYYKITYQVRKKDASKWTSFPIKKKAFAARAKKYFGHLPFVSKRLAKYELTDYNMMELIKTAEYHYKAKHKESLYFNKFFEEANNKNTAYYTAKVTHQKDTSWVVDYYNKDAIAYSVTYSSFFPNKKNGTYKSYYPNGKTRESIEFKNDSPTQKNTFYENGEDKYEINYKKINLPNVIARTEKKYKYWYDNNGKDLLIKQSNVIISQIDPVSNNKLFYKIKDNQLASVHEMIEGKKVFHFIETGKNIKITRVQNRLNLRLEEIKKTYKNIASENPQGLMLVTLHLNEKGALSGYELHNSIHPKLDEEIKNFLDFHLSEGYFKLKPFRNGKEKVAGRLTVNFSFEVNHYYKETRNFYYDPFFHQQIYQHNLDNIQAPNLNFPK